MKPVVDTKKVLDDIRLGMSDAALMAKYSLSPLDLDTLMTQLKANGAVRLVSAKDLLRDIRSGKTSEELAEKYELSPQALEKLLNDMKDAGIALFKEQVREKKRISVRDIEADIRSGATESQLMETYGLSSRGLHSAFRKLVKSGVLTWDELRGVYSDKKEAVTLQQSRNWHRSYPVLTVATYERDNPGNAGKVKDLSENGVGLIGFRARVGESNELILIPDELTDLKPFFLVAECRWFKPGQGSEQCAAGFEITWIDGKASLKLQELVQLTTLTLQ